MNALTRARRREVVEEIAREALHFVYRGGPAQELKLSWVETPLHSWLKAKVGNYQEELDATEFMGANGPGEAVERAQEFGGRVVEFSRRVMRHELDEGIRLSTEVRWGARPELAEVLNELELVVDRLGA